MTAAANRWHWCKTSVHDYGCRYAMVLNFVDLWWWLSMDDLSATTNALTRTVYEIYFLSLFFFLYSKNCALVFFFLI